MPRRQRRVANAQQPRRNLRRRGEAAPALDEQPPNRRKRVEREPEHQLRQPEPEILNDPQLAIPENPHLEMCTLTWTVNQDGCQSRTEFNIGAYRKSSQIDSYTLMFSLAQSDKLYPGFFNFEVEGLLPEYRISNKALEAYKLFRKPSEKPDRQHAEGCALIINNYEFKGPMALPKGKETDDLRKLLQSYGYQVEVYENVSASELKDKIQVMARKPNIYCFLCFISSHGNYKKIGCPDGSSITLNKIFKAADTSVLKEKPKCFFIDACRNGEPPGKITLPDNHYFAGMSCLGKKSSLAVKDVSAVYFSVIVKIFSESFKFPIRTMMKTRDLEYLIKKVHRDVEEIVEMKPMYESSLMGQLFLQGIDN